MDEGRIAAIIPGSDGRIRQAMVQTTGGLFRRPVTKLAVLQVQGDGNAKPEAELQERYGSGDVANASSTADLNTISDRDTPRSRSVRTN